jgi:hypothetical protein
MRAGAIIVSHALPPLDFYVGSPMIVLDDWSKLRETLVELLDDPHALAERQRRTLDWWDQRCSEKAVGDRIALEIRRLTGQT